MVLFLFVVAVLVLGSCLALLTSSPSRTRLERLRTIDPRAAEQIERPFMSGDGGHHKEDWR